MPLKQFLIGAASFNRDHKTPGTDRYYYIRVTKISPFIPNVISFRSSWQLWIGQIDWLNWRKNSLNYMRMPTEHKIYHTYMSCESIQNICIFCVLNEELVLRVCLVSKHVYWNSGTYLLLNVSYKIHSWNLYIRHLYVADWGWRLTGGRAGSWKGESHTNGVF